MNKLHMSLMAALLMVITGCGGGGDSTPIPTPPSAEKAITTFSIAGSVGTIDETEKTIVVSNMPFGTNVKDLVATFTTTGKSITVGSTPQISGTTANDFTHPVQYSVVAADDTSVKYTVTVTVSASANIPAKLPKTGQTTCYDTSGNVIPCANTGQDGDLQKGVAWPNPRFTDNGDQTITDNLTGLMWTKDGNAPGPAGCTTGAGQGWQAALDYTACLNTNNYLGYNDWRLPNRTELKSLVNYNELNSVTWLTTQGFVNVQSASVDFYFYWSSTSYAFNTNNAWCYRMYSGTVRLNFKSHTYYLWPVRTGKSGSVDLPQTGQTTCYDASGNSISCANTGQDGDVQKGVTWPNPRFTDNGDQTITDNLTGLIWTKDGNAPGPDGCTPGTTKTWQDALSYTICLNTYNFLGYNDWRLPNVNEQQSLVHLGQPNIATWLNTQGFSNVQANWYWLSTTPPVYTASHPMSPDMAWFVGMDYGLVDYGHKTYSGHLWPVRAGQ